MRIASPLTLGLCGLALSATAPPSAAEDVRVLESKDCVDVPTSSLGDEFEEVCGFSGLALNEAGDRLLTAAVAGRIQLWSREGEELAAFQSASTATEQLMFAGGRALFLDGHGALVLLDAATGAETARFDNMPNWGQLHRVLDGDLLYLTTYPPGGYIERETILVSLADGAVRVRRMTGGQPRYASAGWAAGVTTHKDSAGVWRATLHLADAALTQVPLERWCEPIGPLPHCVLRDIDGPFLHLFDLATRRWSRHDMGAPLLSTTMVEWAQAGGRSFPIVCPLQAVQDGNMRYDCRIVDLADGRIVHRFEAGRYIVAGGVAPGGAPEFRLAAQAAGDRSSWTVSRIALDGRVEPVGQFDQASPFSVDGAAGLLWASAPDAPGTMAAAGASGQPLARVDARFAGCSSPVVTWRAHACKVSADRRRIAGLTGDSRILWGPILWLEAAAPAGPPVPRRPDGALSAEETALAAAACGVEPVRLRLRAETGVLVSSLVPEPRTAEERAEHLRIHTCLTHWAPARGLEALFMYVPR